MFEAKHTGKGDVCCDASSREARKIIVARNFVRVRQIGEHPCNFAFCQIHKRRVQIHVVQHKVAWDFCDCDVIVFAFPDHIKQPNCRV